jgi:hypothetical protein
MTTEQKIIRAKVGLLELAKQLSNVSKACKMMGLQSRQFLPLQGALRQRRGTGVAGDLAAQARCSRTASPSRSRKRSLRWRLTGPPSARSASPTSSRSEV